MAISPTTGLPIAFLDPRNAPRRAEGARASALPERAVPDDRLNVIAQRTRTEKQQAEFFANRRIDKGIADDRSNEVRFAQTQVDDALTERRAIDALRNKQDLTGPDTNRAVNQRADDIRVQRDLAARQIERQERSNQLLIEQIAAERRAELSLRAFEREPEALFDPTAPRGSLIDIRA